MIETLKLWSRYSLATDETLGRLLATLPPEAYAQERPTYYKSLAGLHLHYLSTYKFYQGLMRKNTGGKYFVSPLTEEAFALQPATAAEATGFAVQYGRVLVEFANTVTEADFAAPKTSRTLRNGKTVLLSLADTLTQYMNHTVHHRGQLSQLLDELGVEHDIGGVLGFAEEAR